MSKANETNAGRPRKLSEYEGHLDSPKAGASVYDTSIPIAGWCYAMDRDMSRCRVHAWLEDELIGETNLFFARADVCAALNLPAEIATGFRFLARANLSEDTPREAEIVITVSWSEDEEFELGRSIVQIVPASLSQRPYGEFLYPEQRNLLHRENIYGSGPAIEQPGAETLELIQQYLTAGSSVLDVGCGAGAYGPALIEAGHQWLGLEVNPSCWDMLTNRNLPFRKTAETASAFPVRPGEFDHAICIEVLEHIRQPDGFLGELSRAIRGRALFSVPNIEVIPYFSAWQVVPWHLLEGDHKNFFTRASLQTLLRKHFARVEVFSYAEHPLRTPDGVALHVHLFAVAEK